VSALTSERAASPNLGRRGRSASDSCWWWSCSASRGVHSDCHCRSSLSQSMAATLIAAFLAASSASKA